MANSFNNSTIILDTFTSNIDVGMSRHGLTECPFFLESIEWQTPNAPSDKALITDASGVEVFSEECTVAKKSIFKPFGTTPIMGLLISTGGVGSGKISIKLR